MSKENNLDKIAVFGPHDRFNYGDLLFPMVIDYCFSSYYKKNIILDKYSLVNSNLSQLGGFKSKNYVKLKQCIRSKEKQIIIVSGGEALSATWAILYSYLNNSYHSFYVKYKNNRIFRNIPKFLLGGASEYPFSIEKKDFVKNVKIIYNAVGGAWQANNIIMNRLKTANLLGVRDKASYLRLSENKVLSYLIPDSAVMISKLYPKNKFDNNEVLGDYIFFQIANHLIGKEDILKLSKDLTNISEKLNLKIVLCPIGTAIGHEDQIPLKILNNLIPNSIFIENPTVPKIIELISFAKIYIGTSLHGIITAMNYGVPYVGSTRVVKQINYIETWSIDILKTSYTSFENLDNFDFNTLLNTDLSDLIISKNIENQSIYLDFFKKIITEIEK